MCIMHKNVDLSKKSQEFLATLKEQLRDDGDSTPIILFEVLKNYRNVQVAVCTVKIHRNATARSLRRQDGDP